MNKSCTSRVLDRQRAPEREGERGKEVTLFCLRAGVCGVNSVRDGPSCMDIQIWLGHVLSTRCKH